MKTTDCNDLKLGIVVVIDSVSKPFHLRFIRSRVRGTELSFQTSGTRCHLANTRSSADADRPS